MSCNHCGKSSSWRNTENIRVHRINMINSIYRIVDKVPNKSREWKTDLTNRIEHSLYTGAGSLEEYVDSKTLIKRIKKLYAKSDNPLEMLATIATSWQNPDRDKENRRHMIADIIRLLQERKPNAPPEWKQKLPDMARRLELRLYNDAISLEKYLDRSTLKERIIQISLQLTK